MPKIISVVGARPNFMKVAALCGAVDDFNRQCSDGFDHMLVHTGQHYDANMSDSFFNDLELPHPEVFLDVGSASHSVQTARVMERFETVLINEKPDLVLVVGDVNSTLACALVTKKAGWNVPSSGRTRMAKLAHVEAGLRSFDRLMPEEINRVVTDSISDYLFTTEESANANLIREGVPAARIHFVGNVMIDTLLRYRSKTKHSNILNDLQLTNSDHIKPYAVLTLHRPGNVDNPDVFLRMLGAFLRISKTMPLIFPAHPRTLKQVQSTHLAEYFVDHNTRAPEKPDSRVRIRLVPPLGYLDFLSLLSDARVVLTDSGGIQEESTILGVPCITLRENTERPVTLENGANVLVGSDPKRIMREFDRLSSVNHRRIRRPPLWDGHASRRIVKILANQLIPQSRSAVALKRRPAMQTLDF